MGERNYNQFGLNEKQEEFCQQFIIDLNCTQAAIRAGYSQKTAHSIGSELLNKLEIQNRITSLKSLRSERTYISQDKVLKEFAKIAFADIRDYYKEDGFLKRPNELSDDAAACLVGLETEELFGYNPISGDREKTGESKKIKLADKIRALDSLGKHLGIFEKDNAQKKTELPSLEKLSEIAEKINKNAAS